MWRGRLFFLCLALALLSGCAPGGPVAEAGADAQLPADKLIAITFDDGPRRNTTEPLSPLRHSRSGQGGSSGNWEKISVRQRWPWAGC